MATKQSTGRIARVINSCKISMADMLRLHEEPVFSCPIDGCGHTGNYGREIWHHLYKDHHGRVIDDGE